MTTQTKQLTLDGIGQHLADGQQQLVVTPPITEVDSFQRGTAHIGEDSYRVRVLTLESVTLVSFDDHTEIAESERYRFDLELRTSTDWKIPEDLAIRLKQHGISLDRTPYREAIYLLAFLSEATNSEVRTSRIDLILEALTLDQDLTMTPNA
jgi:hypothetical protein